MNYNTKSTVTLIALLVVAVLAIIFGPLAVIWSLNTLFTALAIPYNFWSWLAVIVLQLTIFYKPTITEG